MTRNRSAYPILLLSVLVICAGICQAAAATPPAYHVTDLGTLGGTGSAGLGINASGQVTGDSGTTGDIESHTFLWTPTTPNGSSGTMIDLGTLGGTQSSGRGINTNGQVTGVSLTSGDAAYHAFLYDGAMHDLGTVGDKSSHGNGINDSGQVTGVSGIGSLFHAFLWTPSTPNGASGTLHELNTLGGTGSAGLGINASGQVTGFRDSDAFLWTPTTPNGDSGTTIVLGDLGGLGGFSSEGQGINASGQVTGFSRTNDFSSFHAFLYDGTMHDIETLGGTYSSGYGINSGGQVTGQSSTPGDAAYVAFLYTSGSGMVDLNLLIDPLSGWQLGIGQAINDAGQITGSGYINNEFHAFLLTPVPEPATLALWRLAFHFSFGGTRANN